MGYYDEDGHYHSFRHGVHKAADRVLHPFRSWGRDRDEVDVDVDINVGGPSGRRPVRDYDYREYDRVYSGGYGGGYGGGHGGRDGYYSSEDVRVVRREIPPHTITIPCHFIHIGDILLLQGRPCKVIRITTSPSTGQHRYLGVDLFNKQLYEESSFASNPSSSVYVQNMLGPVFKQYRLLDIRPDGRVAAMTESGDVKQAMRVIDQNHLWSRLQDAFAGGREGVRVLVINDGGRELVVDYKVVSGSKL